jgi:hypothetical protein
MMITLNLEEKEQNCSDFIKSDCFTEATYGVIVVVRQNILRMINLVELYGIVLNRIESGDFRHNFPDEEVTRIKQLILVDALSKIMIIVESLFILFDSFSKFSYREIPSIMVRNAQKKIDGFIEFP